MRTVPFPPGVLLSGALVALALTPFAQQTSSSGSTDKWRRAPVPEHPPQADYDVLTDNRVEVVNFNPEPFAGLAFDQVGKVWAVNPYASTVVCYSGITAVPDLVIPTGLNPVSVAIVQRGPLPEERDVLVVCAGTHAAFLYDGEDGALKSFVRLESEPADVEVDADNGWAFVACRGTNAVLQLDLGAFEVMARYEVPCGQRPAALYLDRGDTAVDSDNRLYVASSVTGNNSIALGPGANGGSVGRILDLDGFEGGELPDEDVFRIDPFAGGAGAVDAVVRGAGSLILDLDRNPGSGDLWILSFDSNNKDPLIDSEPELRGDLGTNQLVKVSGVGALSSLIQAPAGLDLDDHDPVTGGSQHDPALSINQARAMDFLTDASGAAEGFAFVASPMSDKLLLLDPDGERFAEFDLPAGAQCYDVEVHPLDETLFVALCLGTMTLEVFSWSPFSPTPFASVPLGLDPTPDQVRRGRDVFLDGQRSQDARFGCYTCHLGGGSDQLGWALRGDPCDQKDIMVTQTLFSIADSFPHHWRGERDLDDFLKAFVGLLGSPQANEPTLQEMADFVVFMQSLQAPANPIEDPRRVLNDFVNAGPAPNGMTGSAVAGQDFFQDVPNFNGMTCGQCHTLESGSNAAYFEEVGSIAPRAAALETAHLRQLQAKGLDTVLVDLGGQEPREVNENGFGAAHAGRVASVFEFIFDTPVFFTLNPFERVDVFKFVEQWDQGISPAAHWATRYHQPDRRVEADVQAILLAGAGKGWNDVAGFGTFDRGGGPEPVRWWYDPGTGRFVPEDAGFPELTWPQLMAATAAGDADTVLVGMPPSNGRRFGIDQDNDGLTTGEELALGTDPMDPDSDGDGWWDGHEDANDDDPTVPQVLSSDDTPPELLSSTLDHATSRAAKYHARFSEDVTYSVAYRVKGGGGPEHTFTRDYFSREDTFVLTHAEPSTPTLAPIQLEAEITLTDRNGNVTGPLSLDDFTPLEAGFMLPPFPLNLHVADMQWIKEDRLGDTLDAEVEITIDLNYNAPDFFPAPDQMVFCIVSIHDDVTNTFSQSTTFTTAHDTTFDVVAEDSMGVKTVDEYLGDPGPPWIVSPLTDVDGQTTIAFQQPGLLPGQTVKVSVLGVVFEGCAPQGHVGTVYDALSLFQLQPLLLEDAQELKLDF